MCRALVEAGRPDEAPAISIPISFPQLLCCWRRTFSGWSPTVTIESGVMWMDVYDAETTKGQKYVQGGGCATVWVGGLIQGGGFGSFRRISVRLPGGYCVRG